jgi:putative ABC transport system permease protein
MLLALWLITRRQWRAHGVRVILTTLGIALGVAVFFAIRTANVALLDSLKLTVEKVAGKSNLQVTAGESGFPEQILDTVRATPGVQIAEPVIEVDARTMYPGEGNLLILGVDTTGDSQLRDYEFDKSQTEIVDPLTYLAQPASILLSRTFAERHALKIGDTLPLLTASGRKDFTVEGIFKPVGIGAIFGGNIAVMDVYSAQVVFGRGHKFDRIDLMTSPDVPVATVQQRLEAQLPAAFQVEAPEARGQDLENAVGALRIGMQITSFIALLVGVYIIFNSFTIAVNQRWKEIGVLRAIGVESHNVNRMFLFEALIMGVLGSLVGIAGGYSLAAGAAKVMGTVAGAIYGVVAAPAQVHWQSDAALAAVALGVVASMLGAWFPGARRIAPRSHTGAAQCGNARPGARVGMGPHLPGPDPGCEQFDSDSLVSAARRHDFAFCLCGADAAGTHGAFAHHGALARARLAPDYGLGGRLRRRAGG